MEGAAIARSKKPSEVWEVLSFLAICFAALPDHRRARGCPAHDGTWRGPGAFPNPCLTHRVLKDWPANEPDVDPAQAPAADARYAHRRAVRRPWLGFRGQV